MSAATVDTEELGDEPLTTSLLLFPMSEGPKGIVDPLQNLPMEAQGREGVIQVASKLKKTVITVGGQQMEVWTEFWNKTTTLQCDMSKLEEQVVKAEMGRQ
ncbi:hypothetical protein F5876DRAFT_66243 [Lentinula aff. lateritia]|uniref:Uncharacterized protein n=1 Tax=Lentinula aff. lateritia TaxID=2804960 RepID=A0ACC1TYT1_9AGAR|nr:hypothetical protein F5876DRAFT_66243 [Lentinula aff. lateritia]